MATIDVKDAAGLTVAIEKPLPPARAAAASSRPVALSNEDFAEVQGANTATTSINTRTGSVTETAPANDTASSGLNGRLQRVAQRITSLIGLLPAALGSVAAAASLAVTQSTEDVARTGIITETAPATDTASSGLNGRLQRIAQRLTSLIALVPASLGVKAAAASFAVTQSTEDAAQLGALTETAPATDTASSGLNGRLQRIAQRLTSLIALLPAALTAGGNLKVALLESTAAQAVTGTFWQATQPVSGTFWQATQPVSAAALPLPTGAATEATLDRVADAAENTDPVEVTSLGLTYTDASIANASGSSQTVAAANASRHYLHISNPSASVSWWLNPSGGTAAANTNGSFELPPGAAWTPRIPPINLVTGIATVNTDLTVVSA